MLNFEVEGIRCVTCDETKDSHCRHQEGVESRPVLFAYTSRFDEVHLCAALCLELSPPHLLQLGYSVLFFLWNRGPGFEE